MTHPPAYAYEGTRRIPSTKRPASIAELAERATVDLYDTSKDFKYFLRLAEKHRKEGKESAKRGDLEGAFVELARAATLVLEKLPTHNDYHTVLNPTQRINLGLNGQDILDNLGELKPKLVDRYDKWLRKQGEEGPDHDRTPNARSQKIPDEGAIRTPLRRDVEPEKSPEEAAREARLMSEELDRWRQQRQETEVREQTQRPQRQDTTRRAGSAQRPPPPPDLSFPRTSLQNPGYGTQNTVVFSDGRPPDEFSRQQEDYARRQAEKRRQDQEAAARRQRDAEDAARIARLTISDPNPSMPVPSAYYPPPAFIEYPSLQSSTRPSPIPPDRQPSFFDARSGPALLPLENPSRYEGDSTDSESVHKFDTRRLVHHRPPESRSPMRPIRLSNTYPAPITTTSPPPDASFIRYPALMSQHQKTQGYYPSLGSMFADSMGMNHGNPSLLFGPNANDNSKVNGALYSSNPASAIHDPQYQAYGARPPHFPSPAPPPPPGQSDTDRIIRPSDLKSDKALKIVSLPRECLQRFLAIAKVNTEMNRETCGLLLGKDKVHKYSVTTLLIPKQHSTSDTCTMDEEELVLQFTEERSLITLGWIHTHPSQSCFMSSVDLHTHSGFQKMLPESFAVVCAPKSNPNFGIFRLTDPPGLQTILTCNEKEAFHPHPDIPIYTDADKGHVQIKDSSLEIVDLR